METALLNKRWKNIDLPNETIQKLSVLAASQGKSLKSFIERILIDKAAGVKIEVSENPSPSGDTWFENPKNIEGILESMEQAKRGEFAATLKSKEDIKKYLGLWVIALNSLKRPIKTLFHLQKLEIKQY